MAKLANVSLASLDARKASDVEFEFPFLLNGEETGVYFSVIGGQSKRVVSALVERVDADRTRLAKIEMAARTGKKTDPVIKSFQEDIDEGVENALERLTGWRGITEPFTPENARLLCESNADARNQIVGNSDNMGNFMKLSAKS